MTFAAPIWLVLLLLPLGLALRRHAPSGDTTISSLQFLVPPVSSWRMPLRQFPAFVRAGAFVVLALAVADPHWTIRRTMGGSTGADVLVLLDVSQSMKARDLEPDRLGAAKNIIRQIVAARPADRIGLLLFAGANVLACPLTSDHAAFLNRLSAVEPSEGEGTAVGAALLGALKRFETSGVHRGVVILLSDGGSNTGVPSAVEAARMAVAAHAPIVAIAIGRVGLAPFPTEMGTIDVPLDVDDLSMQAVSDASAGAFVSSHASNPGLDATRAIERLASPTAARTISTSTPVSSLLAAIAVGLMLMELVVSVLVLRRWR